jgi:hypothetical protein
MQDFGGLENTFKRSWELLSSNWILIVPGLVIGMVAAILIGFFVVGGAMSAVGFSAIGAGGAGIGAVFLSALIVGVIGIIAMILTIAYTTGMSAAAWKTGRATLADGAAAFRADSAALLVAIVLLFIIGILAAALSIPTLGLALLAFWVFFLYVFPAIVVGGRDGVAALSESARIAARNIGPTLLVVVLLALAFLIGGVIARAFGHIPLIGLIVREAITQIVVAYASLVVVGEYARLRPTLDLVGVGMPPSAGSPPPQV